VQSEKLNLLGQLASSMAHEINNPLAIISGNVQLLLMGGQTDDERQKLLEKINAQTERGYKIIHRLLNFSRLPKEEISDIRPNDLINETLELVEHKVKHGNITIERHFSEVEVFRGNPTQIQEVLLNLFVNAGQAMPGGGILAVSTEQDAECIRVRVKDSGVGIAEKDLKNIFDPFFTKGKENGTGLGLFVADQVMKLHKGSIVARSKPGEGTTFILTFPRASAPEPEANSLPAQS
jgi:two-component system NtrC family sensor kinase